MNADGTAVNLDTLDGLLDFLLTRGVSGFFVCGGTGEGLLQSVAERKAVLERVMAVVRGRAHVIAHVGALATQDAQTLASHAAGLGVDAVAAVPPFYFRVDRAALVDHYRLIAEAADGVPTHVYNIPVATHVEINAEIVKALMEIPNVAGIKYTSSNFFDLQSITKLRPDFTVLSGFDEMCLAGLSMGAHGAIGTTYNIMPATFTALYQATQTGDWAHAQALQTRANDVIQGLLSVPTVAAVKAILTEWGYDCGTTRRPQRPLTGEERSRLFASMEAVGLEALERDSLALLAPVAA